MIARPPFSSLSKDTLEKIQGLIPELAKNPSTMAEILTTPENTLKIICGLSFKNFMEFRREYSNTQKAKQINEFYRTYSLEWNLIDHRSQTTREQEQKYLSDNPLEILCFFMLTDLGAKDGNTKYYLQFLHTILNSFRRRSTNQNIEKCLASLNITYAAMQQTINLDWAVISQIKSSNGYYINLTNVELDGKNKTPDGWVDLSNTCNVYADNAELSQLNFQDAIFANSSFTHTNMTNVILNNVDLGGSDLTGICFKQVKAVKANFNHTCMKNAKIANSDLSHANLEAVDFSDAELDKVNLSHTNLRSAILSSRPGEYDLSNADLTGASIYNLSALAKMKLTGANLTDAHFFTNDKFNEFLDGTYHKYAFQYLFTTALDQLNTHQELAMIKVAIANDLARIALMPKNIEQAKNAKHMLNELISHPFFSGHPKEKFQLLKDLIHHSEKSASQKIFDTAMKTIDTAMKNLPSVSCKP